MVRHGVDRGVRQLAVEPVLVQGEAWDGADRIADLEALHAWTDHGNGPGRLVPPPSRPLGLPQVLPAAEHRLGAIQPQRRDANLDLALPGWRNLDVIDLKDLGATNLVKPHDARHGSLPLRGRTTRLF